MAKKAVCPLPLHRLVSKTSAPFPGSDQDLGTDYLFRPSHADAMDALIAKKAVCPLPFRRLVSKTRAPLPGSDQEAVFRPSHAEVMDALMSKTLYLSADWYPIRRLRNKIPLVL